MLTSRPHKSPRNPLARAIGRSTAARTASSVPARTSRFRARVTASPRSETGANPTGVRATVTNAVNVTALPAIPRLAGHLRVGCSTGFFAEHRGDWPSLIDQATALSLRAIELTALSEDELPGLLAFLGDEPSLPCDYVSVHAPSKGRQMAEKELVALLASFPPWVETIVAHPDTFEVPERWNRLGRRLAVENMDRRKHGGRTAQELATVFEALPDASLCFDIAHAWAIDGSMREGEAILDRCGGRLRQLHVSSLDGAQHHVPLTHEHEELFSSLLDRCRDVPWILEAAPRST